jgi:hypothetical protein
MKVSEFAQVALNYEPYREAMKILKDNGSDFTNFSCSRNVIDKIIEFRKNNDTSGLKDLITLIDFANQNKIDIENVKEEIEKRNAWKNEVDEFFDMFRNRRVRNRLFLVVGETGVGKTFLIEKNCPNAVKYACSKSLDSYSLCWYLADKDGSGLKPYPTPFQERLRNGGEVFLDEMNTLPLETMMFIQGITDEKKSVVIGDEEVVIHKDFRIIGALNPPSETDERDPIGDALLSRAIGIGLELTDELICSRLNVKQEWVDAIRELFTFLKMSDMIDVRELNFRDFQTFSSDKNAIRRQLKFKMFMGDVKNIADYKKISELGEFKKCMDKIDTLYTEQNNG